MLALLALLVCTAGDPSQSCERVFPEQTHADTGQPLTMAECWGPSGQGLAAAWLREHPGRGLAAMQCFATDDPDALRERLQGPRI